MSSASSPLPLSNKVAIVAGASRGICAGIALELLNSGAKIVITYTSASSGGLTKELVLKIKELGDVSDAIKFQADLCKVGSPDKNVEATRSAFGDQIDILVNNAGAGHIKAVEGLTRCFAAELGPAGHSVNFISLGPVKTDLAELSPPGLLGHLVSLTPLQHCVSTADGIAQTVAFLAEEGSRWLTGQTIAAAGGLLML